MRVLLIDTSKPTVWVALIKEEKIITEKEWEGGKDLGGKLLVAIEEMVFDMRPGRIAVHRGPGHFMATRTGVVTAQCLAQAWEIELVGVAGDDRAVMVEQAQEAVPVGIVEVAYS